MIARSAFGGGVTRISFLPDEGLVSREWRFSKSELQTTPIYFALAGWAALKVR